MPLRLTELQQAELAFYREYGTKLIDPHIYAALTAKGYPDCPDITAWVMARRCLQLLFKIIDSQEPGASVPDKGAV